VNFGIRGGLRGATRKEGVSSVGLTQFFIGSCGASCDQIPLDAGVCLMEQRAALWTRSPSELFLWKFFAPGRLPATELQSSAVARPAGEQRSTHASFVELADGFHAFWGLPAAAFTWAPRSGTGFPLPSRLTHLILWQPRAGLTSAMCFLAGPAYGIHKREFSADVIGRITQEVKAPPLHLDGPSGFPTTG
jgi:hypothetical protein